MIIMKDNILFPCQWQMTDLLKTGYHSVNCSEEKKKGQSDG